MAAADSHHLRAYSGQVFTNDGGVPDVSRLVITITNSGSTSPTAQSQIPRSRSRSPTRPVFYGCDSPTGTIIV